MEGFYPFAVLMRSSCTMQAQMERIVTHESIQLGVHVHDKRCTTCDQQVSVPDGHSTNRIDRQDTEQNSHR